MKIKHLYGILFLLLFILSCNYPKQSANNIEFIILQMNDVYEIAPLEGGKAGGLARVAQVRQNLLKENPNTISILAGDFLSPSFIGTLKGKDGQKIAGLQMIEALNALGLDYVTLGNHEFDIKDPEILQKRMDQSNFEYTVCNAFYKQGDLVKPFQQNDKSIPSYIIKEFKNKAGVSLKVGFIGVVLPFNQQDYVQYLPVEATFRETFKFLQPKVDFCIGITHLEIDQDMALAKAVPGLPLFIGGHDHTNMIHEVGNTRITKADANAKTIYIHRISFDPSTKKVDIKSELKKIDDSISDEAQTKAVVEKWQKDAFGIMNEMGFQPNKQVLTLKEPLVCKESLIRTQPTNYGKLTVKAFANAISDADVYLINSGSMRLDDNLFNVVTEYDVLRTFPYGGSIVTMELKGQDLQKLLQIGLVENKGEGGYMQQLNVSEENGQFSVKDKVIDLNKTYKVVLPSFVAKGLEANLGFLKNFDFQEPKQFQINGQSVKNDVRDIVIAYMLSIGSY